MRSLKKNIKFIPDNDENLDHVTADDHDESWLVSYADVVTLLLGFFIILFSFSKVNSESFENIKRETSKSFGGKYEQPFKKLVTKLKQVVSDSKMENEVEVTQKVLGAELTFRGAFFFESGSAEIRPEVKLLLDKLIPTIKNNSEGMRIVIEGHTDNRPISSAIFPSNWELSSVRACTVLRYFIEKNINSNNISAIGWGDQHPILPNDDSSGNPIIENQARNRRVVIKIEKSSYE
jgi:chemotaxis protein MotB